jgi:glutamine synthetase
VDAYKTFMDPKNVALFSSLGVMSETEMRSREEIYFENYAKIVNIEALTMIVMASRDYIPAVTAYVSELADTVAKKLAVCPDLPCTVEKDLLRRLSALNDTAYAAVEHLREVETAAASIANAKERAACYCDRVLPAMQALRAAVDEMETLTASKSWPVPTYGDMMFRV